MTVILKNNAVSTLTTPISASDTGIVVASVAQFPTLAGGDYFYATLVSPAGTTEIVKVTARVGNSMTVVRAQDGSSAASFQVGALVEMRANAASIRELRDEVSEISIADAGGYYTSTNVEGALQEVGVTLQDNATRATVAALLADTTFTYTTGVFGSVVAGGVIRTREEGFAYKVAASIASDHHVTTAGGVKLYVLPVGGYASHFAFGAVGDNVTDDTVAVQRAWNSGLPMHDTRGSFRITSQLTIPTGAKIAVAGSAALVLAFQNTHGIISTDVADCDVRLNIVGTDIDPSGVLDAVRVTRAVRSRYDLTVKNSHDIGARFIDCDECDVRVDTSFNAFRGYALITDGCNLCKVQAWGRKVNFGVLITGPYLSGGSNSTRSLASYIGGVTLSAIIEDHDGVGVDVNGSINTTVADSTVSDFTPTPYNNNGASIFACFQVKGGAATKGTQFSNIMSINGGISFGAQGAGDCTVSNLLSINADWSPVIVVGGSNRLNVDGVTAINWGINRTNQASYGGLTFAPIVQVANGSNGRFTNIAGTIDSASPKAIGGLGVVAGNRNSFDFVTLNMMNGTPQLVYGIFDSGAGNSYGEGCAHIFTTTAGGVTKTYTQKATKFSNPSNTGLPVVANLDNIDVAAGTTGYRFGLRRASMCAVVQFTQLTAFGVSPPGEIAVGDATFDSILARQNVPSSAAFVLQAIESKDRILTGGCQINYYQTTATTGRFAVTILGFPL